MANPEHLAILKQGVETWNKWRGENPDIRPNLKRANLSKADLSKTDISKSFLSAANLEGTDINRAVLVESNFNKTKLTGCRIYGISAWNLNLKDSEMHDLIITPKDEPVITVDNLEVAQFIYLLLHNEKIRNVIDTITSKVVLILGRFTPERKAILDAIREELRENGYIPVMFDFDKPTTRNTKETISTLAHMAKFVIADITKPKSVPQELEIIIPNLRSVPVQPILQGRSAKYGMFDSYVGLDWVLEIYRYKNLDDLLKSLKEKVIKPAEQKVIELQEK
jgi:hypothetical protein